MFVYNIKFINENMNVIFDIRTKKEFCSGHICGAYHVDTPYPPFTQKTRSTLYQKLQDMTVNLGKEVTIFVYCKKGIRAAEAKEMLHKLGFNKVVSLGGVDIGKLGKMMKGKITIPGLSICKC